MEFHSCINRYFDFTVYHKYHLSDHLHCAYVRYHNRFALNQHILEECVNCILKEDRLVSLFYSDHAILCDEENIAELVSACVYI